MTDDPESLENILERAEVFNHLIKDNLEEASEKQKEFRYLIGALSYCSGILEGYVQKIGLPADQIEKLKTATNLLGKEATTK